MREATSEPQQQREFISSDLPAYRVQSHFVGKYHVCMCMHLILNLNLFVKGPLLPQSPQLDPKVLSLGPYPLNVPVVEFCHQGPKF